MLKRTSSRRRLLRKRMYKSPHARKRRNEYFRENKNLIKAYQKEYIDSHSPIKPKRRPKREVTEYKMSYRYKYYIENDEDEEESE